MDRWSLAGGCAPGSLVGGAGWAPGCGGGPWLETLVGALVGGGFWGRDLQVKALVETL